MKKENIISWLLVVAVAVSLFISLVALKRTQEIKEVIPDETHLNIASDTLFDIPNGWQAYKLNEPNYVNMPAGTHFTVRYVFKGTGKAKCTQIK